MCNSLVSVLNFETFLFAISPLYTWLSNGFQSYRRSAYSEWSFFGQTNNWNPSHCSNECRCGTQVIHLFILYILVRVVMYPESIQGTLGRWKHSLDGMLVCHRAPSTHIHIQQNPASECGNSRNSHTVYPFSWCAFVALYGCVWVVKFKVSRDQLLVLFEHSPWYLSLTESNHMGSS